MDVAYDDGGVVGGAVDPAGCFVLQDALCLMRRNIHDEGQYMVSLQGGIRKLEVVTASGHKE